MYEFSRIYFFKSNLIHPKNGMWLFRLKSHENGCFAIKQDIRIIILLDLSLTKLCERSMTYNELSKQAEQLSYRDKLRLAQLLIQLARKEEEEQNPEKRETATASAPSDPELVQYVADRLKKLKPSKKETLLNSIGAMFQFQGGISDSDKEKLFSELLKKRHITIAENNRVHYPE